MSVVEMPSLTQSEDHKLQDTNATSMKHRSKILTFSESRCSLDWLVKNSLIVS